MENIEGSDTFRMKRNLAVVLCFLVLAAGLLAVSRLIPKNAVPASASGSYVLVKLDGQEYERISLDKPGTYEIAQENGDTNVLEVTEEGVRMVSSNCRNQLCVSTGLVTRKNAELLPNQGFIICLPHRLSVEVVFADNEK